MAEVKPLRRLKLALAWALVAAAGIALLACLVTEPVALLSILAGVALAWALITLIERYA